MNKEVLLVLQRPGVHPALRTFEKRGAAMALTVLGAVGLVVWLLMVWFQLRFGTDSTDGRDWHQGSAVGGPLSRRCHTGRAGRLRSGVAGAHRALGRHGQRL
jgi:hypothetical protein